MKSKKKTTTKKEASKPTTKKVTAKKPVTKKAVAKPAAKKVSVKTVAAKKVVPGVDSKHHGTKCDEKKCSSSDMILGLFTSSELSDLFMVIIKIIIFGAIISLSFSHGNDNLGVIAIGAVVTAYAGYRCAAKHSDEHKKDCGLCLKTTITGGVVGGISTWIFMVIGSVVAGDTGYILGIIIGITVALRVAPKLYKKV